VTRSIGVTVSAILALIGSVLCLLFGVLLLFSAAFLPEVPIPDGQPAPPAPVGLILLFEGIGAIGVAMIGIAFAIGLFKLQKWARIGFIVFAGILCFFGLMEALGAALIGFAGSQLVPQGQELPPGSIAIAVAMVLGMAVVSTGIGTGWLIFFTRPHVKVQFYGGTAPAPSRYPLAPRVIAWIMIVGSVFAPVLILGNYPLVLFGIVFRGIAAKIVLVFLTSIGVISGIGILRRRSWAYNAAIAYYGLTLINQLSIILIPGVMETMQNTMMEIQPQVQTPMASFTMSFGAVFGAIACAVPLWFLIRRRKAFLAAIESVEP
jgi:hypothetical protein